MRLVNFPPLTPYKTKTDCHRRNIKLEHYHKERRDSSSHNADSIVIGVDKRASYFA